MIVKDYDSFYNKWIKPNAVAFLVGATASYFLTDSVIQAMNYIPLASNLTGTSKLAIANGLFAAAPITKSVSTYY